MCIIKQYVYIHIHIYIYIYTQTYVYIYIYIYICQTGFRSLFFVVVFFLTSSGGITCVRPHLLYVRFFVSGVITTLYINSPVLKEASVRQVVLIYIYIYIYIHTYVCISILTYMFYYYHYYYYHYY